MFMYAIHYTDVPIEWIQSVHTLINDILQNSYGGFVMRGEGNVNLHMMK